MYIKETGRIHTALHDAIERCAEDTITEEQKWRVLMPVLERIRAGEYDESLRKARLTAALKEFQAVSAYIILMIE